MADSDSTIGVGDRAAETGGREVVRDDYPSLELISREHYIMAEPLARGGMGLVTRARDRRLGREVAIKSLIKNHPELAARLEREARITARLHHPAIVNVHEAGVWPGGEPFYAMELVVGRPFGDVIGKTVSLPERLALLPHVIAVADALAYAHAQRIIHRDLKPSNVLVGEFGETVVIDWGLAKDLGMPEGAMPSLGSGSAEETAIGTVLGTPAYMPPEQAQGKVVDARADVYALGSLLYYMLAGKPPYGGASSDAVIASVLEGPPPDIAVSAAGAPSDLVTIVRKAMKRDPDERYPTARELSDDLRRFQTGQLVGSHRYTMWQLARRWLRRYRATVSIATVMIVALAIVSVMSVQRIIRARTSAEDQQHRAEAQAELARAAEARVTAQLAQIKAEQDARSKAEEVARTRGTEVELTKEQLQDALAKAEKARAVAEQEKVHAEEESRRARDAEARAEAAAAAEKRTADESRRFAEQERARAKALEAAPASEITTKLRK
ncbi:MAG: protein kinase [Kofleriaceae bacterium]